MESRGFTETFPSIYDPSVTNLFIFGHGLVLYFICNHYPQTIGPWGTTLTWMYSYDGYIQPKYCKCYMQEKLIFRLPRQLIKDIFYVEANVMNIYAQFQLHPPHGFWEEDF